MPEQSFMVFFLMSFTFSLPFIINFLTLIIFITCILIEKKKKKFKIAIALLAEMTIYGDQIVFANQFYFEQFG